MSLSHLQPPLVITTRYPEYITEYFSCRPGVVETRQFRCPTYSLSLEEGPTTTVECDGNAATAEASCPAPIPVCVFWNGTSGEWSTAGVTTRCL